MVTILGLGGTKGFFWARIARIAGLDMVKSLGGNSITMNEFDWVELGESDQVHGAPLT